MYHQSGIRRLAIATCPWLALALNPVYAQEPNLAEPPRQSDLGFLLGASESGQAETGVPAANAQDKKAAVRSTVGLAPAIQPVPADPNESQAEDSTLSRESDEPQPVVQNAVPELQEGAGELGPNVETIRERYPNRRIRIERQVTQDALGNYLNHGSWKMWDERGTLMAEGRNIEGLREGVWNRWHTGNDSKLFGEYPYSKFTPPFVSQAEFKDGQLHGAWTIFDGKQHKISEWNFTNGQRQGVSVWFHPNGKKLREINYKDGTVDGEVLEYTETGKVSKNETFQQGRQPALQTENYPDGAKKTQGMYLRAPLVVKAADDWWNALPAVFTSVGKAERHGEWMTWYPNGQEQLRGNFQNDKEDGLFVWWYPNGQKSAEGEYRAGQQQGTWVWWHTNGQKSSEGDYRDGDQVGRWTVWNDQGRVTQASEHVGTEHKPLEAVAGAAKGQKPESPTVNSSPQSVRNGKQPVDTARAPRFLPPNKQTQR
jgi:antitoxin component YwqK of YwqJK toxin-antitoxin module